MVINVARPASAKIDAMAVGTSGNQFKNAPIAGKMMVALIDHCEAVS